MPDRRRDSSVASISTYLFWMTVAVTLPILVFFVVLLLQLEQDNEASLERRTARDARTTAISIERQLQDIKTTLQLLATAPELESGDLEEFHERSRLALVGSSFYVILLSEDGQQMLNTRVDYGTPLGSTVDMKTLQSVLSSGELGISGVFFGQVSQHWVFNVLMPLPFDVEGERAVLLITINADELTKLIVTDGLSQGWSMAIVDQEGLIISQAGRDELKTGEPLPFADDVMDQSRSGVFQRGDELIGYSRLQGWDWRAVVWGPVATAQASVFSNRGTLLFGGLALLAIAVLSIAFIGRQLRRPIQAVSKLAQLVGKGEIVSPIRTNLREVNDVSLALTDASFARSQAEDRIRLVVNELAHRTKNMLTIVQVMIRQTARNHDVPEDYKAALLARLSGFGTSIDLLAREKWQSVSFIEFVHAHLDKFASDGEQLELAGQDFQLKPEAVHPVGLAFHELATNCMKYGAFSVPEGRLRIEWTVSEDPHSSSPRLTITWHERGGPAVTTPERSGFGTVITSDHVSAATNGTVTADYAETGLVWSLNAPLDALRESAGRESAGKA